MQKKRKWRESFRKWNFLFFFRLIQKISMKWSRRFFYLAIEDKSIYQENYQNPILNISVLRKNFPNPIGISSGFDKFFKYNDELMQFGFGFEEFGTITVSPESMQTHLLFLPSQKGIFVNAHKFENVGVKVAQKALIDRRHLPYIAGINIASNIEFNEETTSGALLFSRIENELVEIVQRTAPFCDYIVLNLSHPQLPISTLAINISILENLIRRLKYVINKIAPIANPALLVKIPLDISPHHIPLLAETLINEGVEGVIVGGYLGLGAENRKLLRHYVQGYIAGAPIRSATTQVIEQFYAVLQNRIPIIASGGVFTGDDAFEKIKAGASLIQIHSAILYEGPAAAYKINKRLAELLRRNGYRNVAEAVGSKFHRPI